MTRRILAIISIIIFTLRVGMAQYLPIYSQYLFNGLLLNPAYGGSREVLSTHLMYRNQWAGFKNAPTYESLSVHALLKDSKTGVGFLFFNENFGETRVTNAYLNYSYRIKFGNGKLAFGLRGGLNFTNFNYGKIETNIPDPAFTKIQEGFILPNFGTGVYYYANNYILGISIPFLLSYKESSNRQKYEIYNDFSKYSYLVTAAYLIKISDEIKLKPATLIKLNDIDGNKMDFNLNVIVLNEKLWLGGAYRLNEAILGTFELQLNPQLRIGYAYDYSLGKLTAFRYSSHEFSLRYEFSYKIKAFNPRYF